MITLLIILIGLGIIGYVWRKHGTYELFSAIFGVCTFGSIFFMTALLIGKHNPEEISREDHSYEIYSLRNTDNMQGSFFLGSGSINQREYYYMFAKNKRGGFIRRKIPVSDCVLFQGTDKPRVEYQLISYRAPKWITFVGPTWKQESLKDIYVPDNTIIEKFKVE